MVSIADFFNQLSLKEKAQWVFTTGGLCIGLVGAVLSPFLVFLLLSITTLSLLFSMPLWERVAQPNPPLQTAPEEFLFDKETLSLIIIGLCALCFSQFAFPLQILLCSAWGAASAWYFIYECVIKSQIALNEALIIAINSHSLSDVNLLLSRGADPFAQDLNSNNAFHHAISDNDEMANIIQALKEKSNRPPSTVNEIFQKLKALGNERIQEDLKQCWQYAQLLSFSNVQTINTFFNACTQIATHVKDVLKDTLNAFICYLREQIAVPQNMHAQNQGGQTPFDLLNTIHFTQNRRAALENALNSPIGNNNPTVRDEPIVIEPLVENPVTQNTPIELEELDVPNTQSGFTL